VRCWELSLGTQPTIRVENLGKLYQITRQSQAKAQYRTFAETITSTIMAPFRRLAGESAAETEEFWALKDVSFEVQPGEVVGIIGRNGAGKSTLLKILSRITKPTTGSVTLNGRVGSLLEVGTGFHPELTGRENVYLNGSILGMSRREIARKFDEIVAFAEVEQFLDTPVKRYSSGMYVRLAFAVAAHLEPEILIVDEVLAVGDAEFQRKCIARMKTVGTRGTTVLVVSHNLAVIEHLCPRVLSMQKGLVLADGDPPEVIRQYIQTTQARGGSVLDLSKLPRANDHTPPILSSMTIRAGGSEGDVLRMGESLEFELAYKLDAPPQDLRVGIVLEDATGGKVVAFSPTFQSPQLLDCAPAEGIICVNIPWVNLTEGDYYINLHAEANGSSVSFERLSIVTVVPTDVFNTGRVLAGHIASTYLPANWSLHSRLKSNDSFLQSVAK
jgi:lipopolysaccharide transport system ATP-binding protein